ncbi:protease HtpX [Virgibacillus sp. C22-A2]|uniref:Protease HtpX n=1 Tax=Virgibacillus tibetensis TaxID=3042313 RepID=A0ABU6KFT1_9BACI|nr:protease HtpX [Virgibacillus sp. C22-A2]
MGKRIFYFLLTNVLVLLTISIIFSLIPGGFNYIDEGGINFSQLLIVSAVIGFTGAFISLGMSRWMAKRMMKVKVINPDGAMSSHERAIVEKVHRLSRTAGLMHMPEVGIYNSPEVNAFATGPSKKRSLVAVSSGLLQQMDDDAVEGVIAHEVAHVANGDMVTMTLLQGVVNTFVVFLARIAAFAVSRLVRQEQMAPIIHFLAIIVFQIIFSVLGSLVVFAYSRHREYHADRGGADLAGKDKMRHALVSLKAYSHRVKADDQTAISTLKINGKKKSSIFSTHPDIDERIKRLA